MRHSIVLFLPAVALAACLDGPAGHGDGRLALEIAPLHLEGVAEAVWDISVGNGDDDVVWSARLTSSAYGAGGSVSYVGPCDADAPDSTVSVRLIGVYASAVGSPGAFGAAAPSGSLDFRDPGLLSKDVTCVAGQDTPVSFDVSVLRAASQGFFDVGVSFANVFCSAKYDCAAGDLLFDEDGHRAATQVLGLSCVAGSGGGEVTALYLDDVLIDCGGGVTATIDPNAAAGNYRDMSAPGGSQWTGVTFAGGFDKLFQVSAHQGSVEAARNGAQGLDARYWTLALGVAADLTGCTLTTWGTADDDEAAGGAQDGVIPGDSTYPVIVWDVDLGACTGNNPVDGAGSDVVTAYVDGGHTFDHGYSGAPPPPAAPTGVGVGIGDASLVVSWDAVDADPAVTSYTATADDGGATFSCVAAAPATGCTITGLTNDTTYGVTVTATSPGGTSDASAPPVEGTPVEPPPFPQAILGQSEQSLNAVAVDPSGNVYVAGHFHGDVTLGATTLSSAGGADVLIAKLDADGDWLWAVRAGGTGHDYGFGIAYDATYGMVVATGSFNDTAAFGPTNLVSAGFSDIFLLRLDASGGWQGASRAGGPANDAGQAVATASGVHYVTGYFGGTADFGATSLPSKGGEDAFVARANANTSWNWVKQCGGTNNDRGYGVAVRQASSLVYVTGNFTGTTSTGGTTFAASLVSAGSADVFAAALNVGTGTQSWAVRGGGTAYELGRAIGYGQTGNVIVGGLFSANGTTTTTILGSSIVSAGGNDAFIARVGAGGFSNPHRAGGTGNDEVRGIAVATAGDTTYVTGLFATTAADFGGTVLASAGSSDTYIASINPTSGWLWAVSAGGPSIDSGQGIALSGGDLYVAGGFYNSTTYGPTTLTGVNGGEGVVARIGTGGTW